MQRLLSGSFVKSVSHLAGAPRGRSTMACAAGLLVLAAGAALTTAGPLTPPAGPISSTYKTLTEVEPRTPIQSLSGNATAVHVISQSGSYYLTGNLDVPAGRNGIVVTTAGVTIDLNGYRITGQAGSLDGISASGASVANLTVKNGSVTTMGDDGIDAVVTRVRIENVSSSTNSDAGIIVGSSAILSSVRAQTNGGLGIDVGSNATIESSVANDNSGLGMIADAGCVVRGCAAINNTGTGIRVGRGSVVVDSSSRDNAAAGADGIYAGQGTLVSRCSVRSNTAAGIRLETGSSALDNNVTFNGAGVLAIGNNSVVERNLIASSTGSGVQMLGSDTRVVGNNLTDNALAVETVGAGGNIIFSNTLSGNAANFAFGAADRAGPTAAIAAGFIPAATSSFANLVY